MFVFIVFVLYFIISSRKKKKKRIDAQSKKMGNFLDIFSKIANKEYQKRIWIYDLGPQVGDYEEVKYNFFVLYYCVLKNSEDYELTFRQERLLFKFFEEFNDFNNLMEGVEPAFFVDTKRWNRVVKRAKKITRVFKHKNKRINLLDPDKYYAILLQVNKERKSSYHDRFYYSEKKVRELIHHVGFDTFKRPSKIPKNFRTLLSHMGCGMVYVHPQNKNITIRIMPGSPLNPFAEQKRTYVIYKVDDHYFDKYGAVVDRESPSAYIPYEEFVYFKPK